MKFIRVIKSDDNKIIDLYSKSVNQPIKCNINIDEYGTGNGNYISGFSVGDTINVRMLGIRNTSVYGFEITKVDSDSITALHPRSKNEYVISLKKPIELNFNELRFEPVDNDAKKYWFAFLYVDKNL